MKRSCEYCGDTFEMRHARHRFCNFYCQRAARRTTKNERELTEAYKRGHTTMIQNALKILTPDFKATVREVLERKLRYGGGSCLVAVKTLTQAAFQKLGIDYKGRPPCVFEAAHIISEKEIRKRGGVFFCIRYAKGTNKKHNGLARRVYKFESD